LLKSRCKRSITQKSGDILMLKVQTQTRLIAADELCGSGDIRACSHPEVAEGGQGQEYVAEFDFRSSRPVAAAGW